MTIQVKDLADKLATNDFDFITITKLPVYKENTAVTNVEIVTNENKVYKLNNDSGVWQETKTDEWKPTTTTDCCLLCGKKFNKNLNGFGNISNYHYVCMEAIDHYSIKMCISMVDAEKKLIELIDSDPYYFNREIVEKSCFFGCWQDLQKSNCKAKKEPNVTILK